MALVDHEGHVGLVPRLVREGADLVEDTEDLVRIDRSQRRQPALRQPGTRLVGSVAYFPEKYGAEIVAVALDILNRRAVPPAVFGKPQLVTPEHVDHIYPNDQLIQAFA